MGESNGRACCILQICCEGGSEKQFDALAAKLVEYGATAVVAKQQATYLIANFDFAPAGTLGGFIRTIVEHAHAHPPQK